MHIFISHAAEDGDFATLLEHRVEAEGLATWVDGDELHGEAEWRQEADRAIRDADALVLIMSPEAKASDHVTYEWSFAMDAGKAVILLLLRSTPLHPRLEGMPCLDFSNRRTRPWDQLLEWLRKLAAMESDKPV